MYLQLIISLALCNLVSARPRLEQTLDHGLTEALSDLQLLIPLMMQDALHEQSQGLLNPAPFHKARESDASLAPSYPAPPAPPAPPSRPRQPKAQKLYSLDGPFSDIPSDAFKLDHRKEFTFKDSDEGRITKKDLSALTHAHSPVHTHAAHAHAHTDTVGTLLQSCLNYFQGRSQPKLNTLELILDLCTELLDAEGVEDFALDDEKRQRIYDLGTDDDGTHHHVNKDAEASIECDCCPYEHHNGRVTKVEERNLDKSDEDEGEGEGEDDGVVLSSNSMLEDIFRLFRPVGGRREWMVINSKNPDERLKQYIDLKK